MGPQMIQTQAGPTEKTDWTAFRTEMPATRKWAYFDHAAVAPLSGPARRAIAAWNEDAAANGDAFYRGPGCGSSARPGSGRPA